MKRSLALVIFAIIISTNAFAAITVAIDQCGTTYPGFGSLSLCATVTGAPANTQVIVKYYATDPSNALIGIGASADSASNYQISWTPPGLGKYDIYAYASTSNGSPTSGSTVNGVIDLVGAPATAFPSNAPNPVISQVFSEPDPNNPSNPLPAPYNLWNEGR